MKKSEFIAKVSEKSGLTKKDSQAAIDATLDVIQETLVAGQEVSFLGFGTFSVTMRAARKARVPGTSKTIDVPATKAIKFKTGKILKDAVASAK